MTTTPSASTNARSAARGRSARGGVLDEVPAQRLARDVARFDPPERRVHDDRCDGDGRFRNEVFSRE